ncbi:uncharacterized protein LOC128242803 [Mya arenaria]|uniref:uncharacterized protein LOC128242803 n=1 Tax=Mya arenaria TaxID=6604 RepID=UPI0022E7CE5A|nr:uncharacterized protein LOC128242803 [Mya arenaria]XP_052816095.1 uncharacterized protein LOC128242803 [Mya arenaria]XP_052816096.1 uncharacterized protein LOC128242803 [Mya arenaria]
MADSNHTSFKTAIRKACDIALPRKQLKVFGIVCLEKDKEKENTLHIDFNINYNEEVGGSSTQQRVDNSHRVSADATELSKEIWKFAQRSISYSDKLKVFGIIFISHRTTDYYVTLNHYDGHEPFPTGSVKSCVGQTIEESKTQTVTRDVTPNNGEMPTKKEENVSQEKPSSIGSKQTVSENNKEKNCHVENETSIPPKGKVPRKIIRVQTEHDGFIEGSENTMHVILEKKYYSKTGDLNTKQTESLSSSEKNSHVEDGTFNSPRVKVPRAESQDKTEFVLMTGSENTISAEPEKMNELKTSETGRRKYEVGAKSSKTIKQNMSKVKLTCGKCRKKIIYSEKCMIKHIKICANVGDQEALKYIMRG